MRFGRRSVCGNTTVLVYACLINEDQWLWIVNVKLFVSGNQVETRIVIADSS